MKITTITNEFTKYDKTLRTAGVPSISTLRRHLRASKASDCSSVTRISFDVDSDGAGGQDIEVTKWGEILIDGRPA